MQLEVNQLVNTPPEFYPPVLPETPTYSSNLTLARKIGDPNYQFFGHEDVLNLFRGLKPKTTTYPNDSRRVAMLLLGGGQAGNNTAGVLSALQDFDMISRTDAILGISCGIPNMFAADLAFYKGIPMYQVDNTTPGAFLKQPASPQQALSKVLSFLYGKPVSGLIDTTNVGRVFRTTRPMDTVRLKRSKKELLAGLLNVSNGETEFHDVREMTDPIQAIDAGISIAGFSTVPFVEFNNGQRYADAFYANPIPIDELYNRGYTDVLVIANAPVLTRRKTIIDLLFPLALTTIAKHRKFDYNAKTIKTIRQFESSYSSGTKRLEQIMRQNNPHQRVGLFEPTNPACCNPLEVDRQVLEKSYWITRDKISLRLTGKVAEPREQLY